MAKLRMEELAQFGLAMDMLIIIQRSVLLEVISSVAKICVLGILKSHNRSAGNNLVCLVCLTYISPYS